MVAGGESSIPRRVYDRFLVGGAGAKAGTQAFRLHAGETPALPAPVAKDLSYTLPRPPGARDC